MDKSITAGEEDKLTINRAKLNSLDIYEITDDELERLERGGSDTTFLNFAIFTISVAASFIVSLFTIKIESDRIYIAFLTTIILGFLAGAILLILWWKSRRSTKGLVKKIKDRMNKESDSSISYDLLRKKGII